MADLLATEDKYFVREVLENVFVVIKRLPGGETTEEICQSDSRSNAELVASALNDWPFAPKTNFG